VLEIVGKRKLGGFRESGGVFFGRNFGGEVGVGHERKLADDQRNARKSFDFYFLFFEFFLDKP